MHGAVDVVRHGVVFSHGVRLVRGVAVRGGRPVRAVLRDRRLISTLTLRCPFLSCVGLKGAVAFGRSSIESTRPALICREWSPIHA